MGKKKMWTLKEYSHDGLNKIHLICSSKERCKEVMIKLEKNFGCNEPEYNRNNELGVWYDCWKSKKRTRSQYNHRFYSITHNQEVLIIYK